MAIMIPPTVRLAGSAIRSAVIEHGWSLRDFAGYCQIPYGTIKNVTRDDNPDRVRLHRARRMARVLGVQMATIVASNEGVPDEPPPQPAKTSGPARRQEREEKRTGPKRANAGAAA